MVVGADRAFTHRLAPLSRRLTPAQRRWRAIRRTRRDIRREAVAWGRPASRHDDPDYPALEAAYRDGVGSWRFWHELSLGKTVGMAEWDYAHEYVARYHTDLARIMPPRRHAAACYNACTLAFVWQGPA